MSTVTASHPADVENPFWIAGRDMPVAVLHDLRAPISSLRLLAEALMDEGFGEDEGPAVARHLLLHIESLERLVGCLFEFARLQAGDRQWILQPLELAYLIDETIGLIEPRARAAGVSVDHRVPGGLVARGHPDRLRRVMLELLENAIRFTPRGGAITVHGELAPSGVELEVADSGRGIPVTERDRVFEPFFRGAAAGDGSGVGLGLPVCRMIVRALGGDIWLPESEDGTRVRLSLPRGLASVSG